MKCPHCGQEHPDTTKFCPETGKKLESQLWVCNNPNCTYREPLPMTAKFCPNCGTSRNTPNVQNQKRQTNSDIGRMLKSDAPENAIVFPLYDIILGKTTIKELYEQGNYVEIEDYSSEEGRCMKITQSIGVIAAFDDAPIDVIFSEDYNDDIEIWSQFISLHKEMPLNKIVKYCKKHHVDYISDDNGVVILIEDGRYVLHIEDSDSIQLIKTYPCPKCGGLKLKLNSFDNSSLNLICDSCNQTYDLIKAIGDKRTSCPSCGSTNYLDDESDYLQFQCNDCGHIWGCELDEQEKDEDSNDGEDYEAEEIICPECGSDDCEDDSSGYLQYKCNNCDHVWGDESDDETNEYAVEKTLYDFFPVYGITIGETTPEEVSDWFDDIEYSNDGTCSAYIHNNSVFARGSFFSQKKGSKTFNSLHINRYEEMFDEWSSMGFDWSLSYNDWISLFRDLDFKIQILSNPIVKRSKDGESYLSAKFRATSNDNSISFGLDFTLGHSGCSHDSEYTLFSIVAGTTWIDAIP